MDDLSPGGVSMAVLILPLSLGFNLPLGRKLGMSGGKGGFLSSLTPFPSCQHSLQGLTDLWTCTRHGGWGACWYPHSQAYLADGQTKPLALRHALQAGAWERGPQAGQQPLGRHKMWHVVGASQLSRHSRDSPSWPQPPHSVLLQHLAEVSLSATWHCQIWWPCA